MERRVLVRLVIAVAIVALLAPDVGAKRPRRIETSVDAASVDFGVQLGPCPGAPPPPGIACDALYLRSVSGDVTAERPRCLAGRQVGVAFTRNGEVTAFGSDTTDEAGRFEVIDQPPDLFVNADYTITVLARRAGRATCAATQTTVKP